MEIENENEDVEMEDIQQYAYLHTIHKQYVSGCVIMIEMYTVHKGVSYLKIRPVLSVHMAGIIILIITHNVGT